MMKIIFNKYCYGNQLLETIETSATGNWAVPHSYLYGVPNMSIPAPRCSCIICHEEFTNKGLTRHFITSHSDERNFAVHEYNKNPNKCIECENIISYYENRKQHKFCSQTCARIRDNRIRLETGWKPPELSDESRRKLSVASSNRPRKKSPKRKAPEFSKVYFCKKCIKFHNTRRCSSPTNSRYNYKFQFNIYEYPDLFDLELLNKVGFYGTGSKKGGGKLNINGMARDHKISITDAIKNNYDSYYITHVLNCELMFQRDNRKKQTKSSITYEELVTAVVEWDNAKSQCNILSC